MFTENRFYWSTCYFIFKGTNFFIYWWHNMTFPFWKMVLADAFVIWYFLNELIITSLYFFTSFLKTNLFWFSIFWAFGYELTKPYLLQQHLTEVGSLRSSSIFKWSTNGLVKKGQSNIGIELINYHGNIRNIKIW